MLRHNYTVVLIQIEHNFFEDKGNQSRRNGKGGLFRMVTQKEGICQLRHFTANGIALRT